MTRPLVQLIALVSLAGSAALPASSQGAEVIEIVVSVPPQADWAEQIGGAQVRVESMIPSGTSPASYSPRPRQLASLAEADLYLRVGHPDFVFESAYIEPQLARLPELRVIDMSEGLEPNSASKPAHPDSQRQKHRHAGGRDPHLWLSPALVEATVRRLTAALVELDPAHARDYGARLERFLEQLNTMDDRVRERLSALEPRIFLVLHPAWGWFAEHYGLDQIAVEHEGKEPGPRRLIPLIEEARRNRIRVVFVQRGFPERSAGWIADEIGGRVVEIDPLAPDWFANLERVADAIGRSRE